LYLLQTKQNKTKTHFHVPRKYQHTAGFPKKNETKASIYISLFAQSSTEMGMVAPGH
jgi:hypothetical protein